MYRHEKILPDEGDEWVDMFGHTLSRQTIQQRIDAGHAYNQKAMAYQMSYIRCRKIALVFGPTAYSAAGPFCIPKTTR